MNIKTAATYLQEKFPPGTDLAPYLRAAAQHYAFIYGRRLFDCGFEKEREYGSWIRLRRALRAKITAHRQALADDYARFVGSRSPERDVLDVIADVAHEDEWQYS